MTSTPVLRQWQHEALSTYRDQLPTDWLVTATPGAGKTAYALATARLLFDANAVRRIIVVVPTDHLRSQWITAAAQTGVDLRGTPNNERVPADADGVVCTYAQVASAPRMHEARTRTEPTLVVFDEIHHAGDDKQWGSAVVDAFDLARHRLAITGTPFRSDDARIPHIRYEQTSPGVWQSVADYTYGYADALRDQVVRPVRFAAYSGAARWESAGEARSAVFGDPDLSKTDEDHAWRAILDPDGQWIPHVFAAMSERVRELRTGPMPDAGALVLASDQETARQYGEVWAAVTGQEPLLILSDDPQASTNIVRFREDPSVEAAVAVRMVSEGVDLPRAAVLGFCTRASTPLFFAQAVGRVVRARRRGEQATVFVPAVRPLLDLAADVETMRDHVIEERPDLVEPTDPADTSDNSEGGEWQAVHSQAHFEQVIASATSAADRDDDLLGIPGLLSSDQEAALLERRDAEARRAAQTAVQQRQRQREQQEEQRRRDVVAAQWEGRGTPQQSDAASASELRRQVAAVVSAYATSTGTPHAQAWAKLYAATPGPKNAAATIEQLRRRLDVANRLR